MAPEFYFDNFQNKIKIKNGEGFLKKLKYYEQFIISSLISNIDKFFMAFLIKTCI